MNTLYCCAFLLLFGTLASAQVGKKSPLRYPKNVGERYSSNVVRKWAFKSASGTCLEFKLKGINMEASNNCANDYLDVFDGSSTLATRKLHTCGLPTEMPPPVRSKSNQLYVVFTSDDNDVTGLGFDALITTIECTTKPITQTTPARRPMYNTPPSCGFPQVSPLETGLYQSRLRREEEAVEQSRIVGGQVSRPHSWSWQVSIRYNGMHICGGSVVSPRHILTAAHCFKTVSTYPNDFEFWVGKHMKDEREPNKEQQVWADLITLHPNYEKTGKHDSDLAVIRLRTPITFNRYVQPICLPFDTSYSPQDGSACYVTGFGTTKGTGGEEELKQAAVPIVSNENCKAMDSRIRPLLTDRMLCAGYQDGRHDSCQGDSGGPLACKIGPANSWVLSGVVSFGFGCAGKSSPGIYVRTTEFLPWLRQQITDLPPY